MPIWLDPCLDSTNTTDDAVADTNDNSSDKKFLELS